MYWAKNGKISHFFIWNYHFTAVKYCSILNGHVCKMYSRVCVVLGQKLRRQVFSWHIPFKKLVIFLFPIVWVEALRPSQQFYSNLGIISWVELVISNKDDVSCSRKQHYAPGEVWTLKLAIKSLAPFLLSWANCAWVDQEYIWTMSWANLFYCLCKTKGPDQNCAADQCLDFH